MAVLTQTPVETVYRVLDIPHLVDGDTLWVVRERTVGPLPGMRRQLSRQIGEAEGVALWAVPRPGGHGMDQVQRDYAGGRKVRLHDGLRGLNTPESTTNKLGWNTARLDLRAVLDAWCELEARLELHAFGIDSFGRLLGDLRPLGAPDAESAVFHMIDQGWEAYK